MRSALALDTLMFSLFGLAVAPAALAVEPATQTIVRAGAKASSEGPEQYFTGRVRLDPVYEATDSINASGAYVTFEPGARSAWHTHPKGQYLVVTQGVGRIGEWGKPVHEIRPGDVVWCPPGVKHWHGAAQHTAMTHMTVSGHDHKNQNVTWMGKVSDEQYNAF